VVDKDAAVKAERITVSSLTVYGTVSGAIFASDKVDICAGANVTGDISARKLRIADGVHYEGQCTMIDSVKEIDIFSRTNEEIKLELQS
jgi:cytoskeletal protein CcmA (bactofilin family)